MNKIALSVGIALIQMMAGAAFAQTAGEADPAQAKAPPTAPTTPAERAQARRARSATGRQAAHGPQMGEGDSIPAATTKVPRDKRKLASATRRAANSEANHAGKFPRGGSEDAPERQKH